MKTLYYGGPIITMEKRIYAEAVLVEDGKILAVGNKDELFSYGETIRYDLQGCTMLPAFLDAHSHLVSVGRTLSMVDLSGTCSIAEIQDRIRRYMEKDGEQTCIYGFGYDHNELFEHRHPVKEELDVVTNTVPMIITHASGHMGVVNSTSLKLLGITEETADPEGGRIGREGKQPNGYLEEAAFMQVAGKLPQPNVASIAQKIAEAEKNYRGFSVLQDGKTTESEWEILRYMAEHRLLQKDVVCYADISTSRHLIVDYPEYREYQNHLRLGGYKLILDGSPQSKTAWLTEPYLGESEYSGYGSYNDEEVEALLQIAFQENTQILVHANGDRAIDQMIRACEKIGPEISRIRPVLIHGQLLRKDQTNKLSQLGILPSLFVAHTYHWGDVHIDNLGLARAALISPCQSVLREQLPFTLHTDSPVISPNIMETIWCACKRQTRSGIILGEEEQISVLEALKSVTTHAAYQYFEENERGSIQVGKKAQFAVLDQNPMVTPIDSIKNIRIVDTIL